jgi:hypothetical protein
MIRVNVQGGTGAGSKQPPREKPKPWMCACGRQHGGHWDVCPDTHRADGALSAVYRRPS